MHSPCDDRFSCSVKLQTPGAFGHPDCCAAGRCCCRVFSNTQEAPWPSIVSSSIAPGPFMLPFMPTSSHGVQQRWHNALLLDSLLWCVSHAVADAPVRTTYGSLLMDPCAAKAPVPPAGNALLVNKNRLRGGSLDAQRSIALVTNGGTALALSGPDALKENVIA